MKNVSRLCRGLIAGAILGLSANGLAAHSVQLAPNTTFSPAQQTAIEKIVHNYLVSNPEVLVEASKALRDKTEKEQLSRVQKAIMANKADLFHNPQTPAVGDPKANINVVEFFDYQCGHCRSAAPAIKALMKDNPNVRFVFKELPIFGGNSKYAAQAALAANQQNKYLELHNKIFSADGPLSKDQVTQYATEVGLDMTNLTKAMNSPALEQQIRDNFRLAEKLGIMGTPAFIIGNLETNQFKFIPGAASESILQAAIQAVKTGNN